MCRTRAPARISIALAKLLAAKCFKPLQKDLHRWTLQICGGMYLMLVIFSLLPIAVYIIRKIFSPYLWEDLKFFLKIVYYVVKMEKAVRHCSAPGVLDVFLQHVSTRPHKTFILYEDQAYSYRDIDLKSNQAAWTLRQYGSQENDNCVAVFMANEPAFIWLWLALSKLGWPMACLNYNIRAKSFLHCFQCSGAKILIAAPEFKDAIEDVLPALIEDGVQVFYLSKDSPTEGVPCLLDKIDAASKEPIPESYRSAIKPSSPALYIYTSGTTGKVTASSSNSSCMLRSGFFIAVTDCHDMQAQTIRLDDAAPIRNECDPKFFGSTPNDPKPLFNSAVNW
ncbi:unnamed protein product [Ranitomeya imitator]|uniref:Long-chain-fatty-acid--CoA ligase n=1 Tax=Ranitomeya imitator TaxID=111125 RepID=A0ABN9L4G7_9NEOB|nr:unnamed protein product [Ranitomeya imitator]